MKPTQDPQVDEYCSHCPPNPNGTYVKATDCTIEEHLTVFSERRIVLSWGDDPPDLDLHLRWNDENVFWLNKESKDRTADLDVDVTTGRGPETITIRKMNAFVYYLFVHNYSQGEKGRLSLSGAKVRLFEAEGLIHEIAAPTDQIGHFWYAMHPMMIAANAGSLAPT